MIREELGRRLGNEDVDPALDGIQGYGEVSGVRGEDGNGRAGLEGINGCFVRIRVGLVVGWE